jgi:hypothetical protein
MSTRLVTNRRARPLERKDILTISELARMGLSVEDIAEQFDERPWVIRSILQLEQYLVS